MTTRFLPAEWRDYALLDSGHGKRLERFGDLTLCLLYTSDAADES